jgi:uncharacterized Tic20 family protein
MPAPRRSVGGIKEVTMPEPHSGTVDPTHPSLNHEPPADRAPSTDSSLSFEPPATSYGPPAPVAPTAPLTSMAPAVRPTGTTDASERNWAVAAHVSGFVAAYVALGFLGPLVVMLTGGSRSAYVRRHAVEALNFNISVLLWLAVSGLLTVVLIGFPMLLGVGILYVVASIRGAMAASRGEEYRYPLTVRLVS